MSSLGDLLLAHLKTNNKTEKVSESDSCNDRKAEIISHTVEPTAHKVISQHSEKKKDQEDIQSNASSTDDYVRELLDPDDRPRNVWHVVEGPKVQPDNERDSHDTLSRTLSDKDDTSVQASEDAHKFQEESEPPVERLPDESRSSGLHELEEPQSMRSDDRRADEERSHRDNSPRGSSHRESNLRDSSHRSRRHRDKSSRSRSHRDRSPVESLSRSHRERDDRDKERDRGSKRRRHDFSSDEDDGRPRSSRQRDQHQRSRSRSKASSRYRERSRSNSQSPITKRNSRTILIMQLSPRVDSRDLEDFFRDIGEVREVRLIMDSKTRRHKGIAYIEFEEASSAVKAFNLSGKKLYGVPVVIQSAQMDRGKSSGDHWPPSSSTSQTLNHTTSHSSSRSHLPPNCYRVYVGGLHVNLTEEMIRSVFEPFGSIVRLELMKDRVTNVSRGYAFITYADIESGQNAVQALDGLELGGKALRVSKSTEKSESYGARN